MRWVLTASTAWLVGISVYIVAAIWWSGYDGCSSLIFLPLSAAIVSGPHQRYWHARTCSEQRVPLNGV